MIKGLLTGIGIGIGIMAVQEAKKAYGKHMFKQKIKNLWSEVKETFNEDADKTDKTN